MSANMDAILDAELDAWEDDDESSSEDKRGCTTTAVNETLTVEAQKTAALGRTSSKGATIESSFNHADNEKCNESGKKQSRAPSIDDVNESISSIMQNMALASNQPAAAFTKSVPSDAKRKNHKSKSANKGAKDATSDKLSPQEADKMLEHMLHDFESSFTNKKDYDQVMDGMMQQMLGKELMYEPMKCVTDLFPKWLAEHKDKISPEEYQRYGTQYQYFQRVIHLYETDPDNFPRLMELMQDMQEYGHPPPEIMKELAPGLQLDKDGMPVVDEDGGIPAGMPPFPFMNMPGGPNDQGLGGDPDDCSIM